MSHQRLFIGKTNKFFVFSPPPHTLSFGALPFQTLQTKYRQRGKEICPQQSGLEVEQVDFWGFYPEYGRVLPVE